MAAMFGSSLALAISDIPFDGPIAGVDVGRINGEYVLNPTVEQAEQTDIELTVAGTKKPSTWLKVVPKKYQKKIC